jgi:MoxR-like ATPase
VRSAKAWAAARGRGHVVPEDILGLAHPILCHRLLLTPEAQFGGVEVDDLVDRLLAAVPAPTDRA